MISSKNFAKNPVDGIDQGEDLVQDVYGHGTMCAGILTLAHNVKIVNLKVCIFMGGAHFLAMSEFTSQQTNTCVLHLFKMCPRDVNPEF